MSDTYVCWRDSAQLGPWTVFRVGPDGRRHEIFCCDRYLDAAKLVRELRMQRGDVL